MGTKNQQLYVTCRFDPPSSTCSSLHFNKKPVLVKEHDTTQQEQQILLVLKTASGKWIMAIGPFSSRLRALQVEEILQRGLGSLTSTLGAEQFGYWLAAWTRKTVFRVSV